MTWVTGRTVVWVIPPSTGGPGRAGRLSGPWPTGGGGCAIPSFRRGPHMGMGTGTHVRGCWCCLPSADARRRDTVPAHRAEARLVLLPAARRSSRCLAACGRAPAGKDGRGCGVGAHLAGGRAVERRRRPGRHQPPARVARGAPTPPEPLRPRRGRSGPELAAYPRAGAGLSVAGNRHEIHFTRHSGGTLSRSGPAPRSSYRKAHTEPRESGTGTSTWDRSSTSWWWAPGMPE